MSGIYCKCDHCGAVAKVGGAVDIGDLTVTFENSLHACPKCGRWARILDGTYVGGESGMDFARGPAESRVIYARLREIAERAKAARPSNEEFLDDVAEVSADLAAALRKVDQGPLKPWLFPIFMLVMGFLNFVNLNINVEIDVNDLVDKAIAQFEAERKVHDPTKPEAEPPELKVTGEIEVKAPASAQDHQASKRKLRRDRGKGGNTRRGGKRR